MGMKISGNFRRSVAEINKVRKFDPMPILESAGREGVSKLSSATPVDTGETASSWNYKIETTDSGYSLIFTNSAHPEAGAPIPILIQYGHGTGNGGYVQGIDFINPVLKPIADSISKNIEKGII